MHKSHSWSRFTYWSNFASFPFRGFLLFLMAFTQRCSPLSNRLTALMSQLIVNEWLELFVAPFWISTEVVHLQRCWLLYGWYYLKLLPPRRVLFVPYIPPCHVTSCKATYVAGCNFPPAPLPEWRQHYFAIISLFVLAISNNIHWFPCILYCSQ